MSKRSSSPKVRNSGQWTEARFRSFVASVLRAGTRRWPPKWAALAAAFTEKRKSKSGREAKHYLCNACKLEFTSTQVQIDHKEPIGDWSDFNVVVEKLFCEKENLQVLCKPCHKDKTKKERQARESK